MFIIDSLLIGSLRFVLDKVAAAAEAEMNDDAALREQLLEAQLRLELGEITDAQFSRIERNVLARIREMKDRSEAAISMSPDSPSGPGDAGDREAPGKNISRVEIESWKPER
jgi:hypothetical protein